MANLRVVRLSIKNSTTIEILFTNNLDTNLGMENVSIEGAAGGVSDPTITSVVPSEKTLTVLVRPMVPRANYKLTLASTTAQPFKGAKGEELVEDGSNNVIFFIGQQESNIVRDNILADIPDLYTTEAGTLVFDTVDAGSKQILNSANAAGEVRSANYVSIEEQDVAMTRGSGPFDRFPDEGVYQLLRVGSTATGAQKQGSITFAEFPSDQVSLQQIFVEEETVSNTSNDNNSFIGLTISLASKPVIIVTAVTLYRDGTAYPYDIVQYKYGVANSNYDSNNAYPAVDLEEDQIRLSTAAVGPSFPLPQGSDTIVVSYFYKRLGRDIDSASVEITTAVNVVREAVPSVATTFFLSNAPVIDSSGSVAVSNGVTWLDPAQNFDPDVKHPAFVTEVPFSSSSLPNQVGEFSVDYETGQVFVYGVNGTGVDGTTSVPPVADYTYKKEYQENLDYIFFSDTDEIASIPNRELRGNPATISFNYEDTFANGTDFEFASHVEVINERVGNNLIEDIGLRTQYSPVNEVFRIYNETTGEIYTPTRISGNEVYFSASQPPRTVNISREAATFESVIQSQLVVTTSSPVGSLEIFTIELSDSDIMSATGGFYGANFNTSLTFSEQNLFVREFYYSPDKTLSENLQRLVTVGDYIVDYESGIVYLAHSPGQSTAVGDATYRKNNIKTKNRHIIRVDDIYRSPSVTLPNTETIEVGTISDETVNVPNVNHVGETTVNGAAITVNGGSITVSSDIYKLRHIFQVTDLQTTHDPINFATGASFSATSITLDSTGVEIDDDADGLGIVVQSDGSREYVTADRLDSLATAGLAELTAALSVTPLGGSFNYLSQGSDGYVDATNNRIYLPSGLSIAGTRVETKYKAQLRGGAAVLVDYVTGDVFVDYTYSKDEILVSYEYGDNVIDWSVSSVLLESETYYVTYRYGALRDSLRDNFGVLTSLEELSTIPDDLDRETYRNAVSGSLQTFLKGPTIPAIETLVEAFTQITPNITESAFQEWILGRDYIHLLPMELSSLSEDTTPGYSPGRFGNGLLLDTTGQTAKVPATSNMKFSEGTWEAFIIPSWKGIENDASLTFDLSLDNSTISTEKVHIGSGATNPSEVPFTLDKTDPAVLGRPYNLHSHGSTGCYIWFDTNANRWRFRTRAPVSENRLFTGIISTSGEFYNVKVASTADGYDGYDGYEIDEINDRLWSTDESIKFSFVVDAYDMMNMAFDAYDAYDAYGTIAGFDGIDFTSDDLHFLFDTGVAENRCRMSLYKDGSGYLKYRIYDGNRRIKVLSHGIHNWLAGETHHVAVSWKIGTVEQRDEMHLFVDGEEVPNMYRFKGYLDVPASANKNTYRFKNPISVPSGSKFLSEASETLVLSATAPTTGGFDLETTTGSRRVISRGANFSGSGVIVGSRFEILDDTDDGRSTRGSPWVYVSNVIGQNILELEQGPPGSGVPWTAIATLNNVRYTVNPLELQTVSDPEIESIRMFTKDSYGELTELNSPNTLTPDYSFSEDGYMDFVNVYNGVSIGDEVLLKTYGLTIGRCSQYVYIWPDRQTNLLNTIMPAPTAISKVNATNIIIRRTVIEPGVFALIATLVGGHLVTVLTSSLDFCQPSNTVTGRSLTVTVSGDNIDWMGLNQVVFIGTTYDGTNVETLNFTGPGKMTTTKFFTSLTDVNAAFTPINPSLPAGAIEIRETYPLNWQENDGLYADIHLSVQEQAGHNGGFTTNTKKLTDGYSRFGVEDIGKTIRFTSPLLADAYSIVDVPLDPSSTAKDSDSVILNGNIWGALHYSNTYTSSYSAADGYYINISPCKASSVHSVTKSGDTTNYFTGGSITNNGSVIKLGTILSPGTTVVVVFDPIISWRMMNTFYGDSGFANGLLTLETARTGGQPFLLRSCWYEVDFPAYLVIPWNEIPADLFTGSDMFGENQADAVIDELRILDEMSIETRTGESLPSSGRSITTDAAAVREFDPTDQTLALFHFNDSVDNAANFITSFSGDYKQSENSVNSRFGQSAVFNRQRALKVDNTAVFKNNEGTIEFWVSPILDTHNDPTIRYYIDLSSEVVTEATATTSLQIRLPARARAVTSVTASGSTINYATGGTLSSDGITFRLGQSLPTEVLTVNVTYVPIATQGDRFSIFKNETGQLVLSVTASGVDYQISAPIYWKKNTWHRVFAGWDLNNSDNQDRLIFMVDGTESGTIRYGTGLVYGTGVIYGQKAVWGSADAGTTVSRNILADINLIDTFNRINVGADFTEQYTALARMDNIRFSTSLRPITYLGATTTNSIVGLGPGRLIGKDLLYTSNTNAAQPVVDDALTGLLLDFNTTEDEVEYLAQIRDAATGIFDFFVEVIDTFELVDTDLAHQLIEDLINKIKPSHTRAFVSFTK